MRDLRSANGLIVNGELVTEAELSNGDEIVIGNTSMRFVVSSAGGKAVEEDEPETRAGGRRRCPSLRRTPRRPVG